MIKAIPETSQEMLDAWDAGHAVQTVQMGGLSDGYDHAIQCAAMEVLREMLTPKYQSIFSETRIGEDYPDWVNSEPRNILLKMDKMREDGTYLFGFSGAQVGAAINLAHMIASKGYGCVYDVEPERLIFISREKPA